MLISRLEGPAPPPAWTGKGGKPGRTQGTPNGFPLLGLAPKTAGDGSPMQAHQFGSQRACCTCSALNKPLPFSQMPLATASARTCCLGTPRFDIQQKWMASQGTGKWRQAPPCAPTMGSAEQAPVCQAMRLGRHMGRPCTTGGPAAGRSECSARNIRRHSYATPPGQAAADAGWGGPRISLDVRQDQSGPAHEHLRRGHADTDRTPARIKDVQR